MRSSKITAVIPARGGSKSVEKKNLSKVGGHPLIAYAIQASLDASLIDNVAIATDDDEIAKSARIYGAEVPFLLPQELTGDNVRLEDTFAYVAKELRAKDASCEHICFIDPTRPVRLRGFLDKALHQYKEGGYDSVISGVREHKSIWRKTDTALERIDSGFTVRQLKKDELYVCYSGLITCTKVEFMEQGERLGENVLIYEFDDHNMTVDIHSLEELRLAELILAEWPDQYVIPHGNTDA